MGPLSFWVMAGILLLNVIFIGVFFKELKISTFDAGLAAALGFSPGILHYSLMTLVSVTAVGAFDAVGSILVVALMIAPPATAYLLTDRLSRMLAWSALIGCASALAGYWLAHFLDASIAGSMATMCGVFFLLAFLAAPERGLASLARRRRRQKWEFGVTMLAVHLSHHEGIPGEAHETEVEHLREFLKWSPSFADRVVRRAIERHLVRRENGFLTLTDAGRDLARTAMIR